MKAGARRLWWLGAISSTGDGMFLTAFPLLAATLTRNPATIAGVTVASRLPWLLFSLIAGAIADRFDRRRLMVIADVARGAIVAALAASIISGDITVAQMYVAAFALSVGEVVHANASQALIPVIVGAENLVPFNAKLSSAQAATETFIGPPIGSALFSLSKSVPFVADALSFGGAAVLAARLPDVHEVGPVTTRLRDDIREGFRHLWHDAILRRLALMISALNVLWFACEAVLVLYAFEALGGGKTTFTVLFLSGAVGVVVMQQFIERIDRRLGTPGAMRLMLVLWGIGTAIFAVATSGGVAAGAFLFMGAGDGLWRVLANSMRQRVTPNHLLGRVNSVHRMFGMGAIPIGAALGGLQSQLWGVRAPFYISAVGFGLAAIFGKRLLAPMRSPSTSV